MVIVAAVAHLLAGLGGRQRSLLGAAGGATDPIAATSSWSG